MLTVRLPHVEAVVWTNWQFLDQWRSVTSEPRSLRYDMSMRWWYTVSATWKYLQQSRSSKCFYKNQQ